MSDHRPLNQRIHDLREDIASVVPGTEQTIHPHTRLLRWAKELAEIVQLLELRTR